MYIGTHLNFVGKSVKSKLESHPANPLLGMMSSYHSDDEEDLQVDSEEKAVKEIESVHQTTAKTTSSKQSQLDEQVADFLRVRSCCSNCFQNWFLYVTNVKGSRTNTDAISASNEKAERSSSVCQLVRC